VVIILKQRDRNFPGRHFDAKTEMEGGGNERSSSHNTLVCIQAYQCNIGKRNDQGFNKSIRYLTTSRYIYRKRTTCGSRFRVRSPVFSTLDRLVC